MVFLLLIGAMLLGSRWAGRHVFRRESPDPDFLLVIGPDGLGLRRRQADQIKVTAWRDLGRHGIWPHGRGIWKIQFSRRGKAWSWLFPATFYFDAEEEQAKRLLGRMERQAREAKVATYLEELRSHIT